MSKEIVACLGSSTTAGKGHAFDWIGELAKRPQNSNFAFLNFSTAGDLAYTTLAKGIASLKQNGPSMRWMPCQVSRLLRRELSS